jgi:hypothetical protein
VLPVAGRTALALVRVASVTVPGVTFALPSVGQPAASYLSR